ncbi:MAG: TetR family transcriptional regulator C-terminal domain-containing protein [Candidatus Dactylopiibacterium sp.]|nr:TetR family transcriptional regulator C-terminal domain-containing protein [Candidatus Dactylopiibacterium sp.]
MDAVSSPPRRRGRPPRQPDSLADTRERLLRAGLEVLTEKGFSVAGLDEILRSARVPKGSFYHYYASKEAFGAALIDRYGAYFAARLDRHFDNAALAPLARLQAFVDDACAGMRRFDFRRGCLIGKLGQEMNTLPEAFRARLIATFGDWQARLARCLAAAREAGEIPPATDCERLAAFFWTGWEGAVLRAGLERSTVPLQDFATHFLACAAARAPA